MIALHNVSVELVVTGNRFNGASMQMTANRVPLHGDETLNWVTVIYLNQLI
jgi:hypothetical protein